MKKQSKLAITLLVGLPMAMITSCGTEDPIVENATVEVVAETTEVPENIIYYQIPSPDEMLGFIKESGLDFSGEFLSKISNADNYSSPKKQALNFGIYSADLAYAAAFGKFNEATKYFYTIKKMAEPLGLSSAFDQILLERAQVNLVNSDSLLSITNTFYFTVVDYLEHSNQNDKLGLIASAGWLETIYITTNTINFSKDKKAVDRLVDQKLTLSNLLGCLRKYQINSDVAEVLTWFEELNLIFPDLSDGDGKSLHFRKKGSKKRVLGKGASIAISENQFKIIKEKINEIRNKIVKKEA